MSDIEFGKVITSESFYRGEVVSTKKEQEVSQLSSREQILKDMIESLDVITKGDTNKLDLCIQIDKSGRWRIVKKWVIN